MSEGAVLAVSPFGGRGSASKTRDLSLSVSEARRQAGWEACRGGMRRKKEQRWVRRGREMRCSWSSMEFC